MVLPRYRLVSLDKSPEKTEVLGTAKVQLEANRWYTVAAVAHGQEWAVTLDDVATLKGRHAAIDADKTEIEFLAGGDSILFDDLKAWTIKSTP